MALQHLRSNTASKRPTPASMADGQLAINTNATSAGLFFKDAAGDLVKVGPVHVGTAPPNNSPAGSSGNALGEQWLDTSDGGYVFKVWDGSAWRSETGQFVDLTGDTMTGDLTISGADLVMSNGEIIAAAGTAATPSIIFNGGGTNTGLYSPGTGQVAISTSGTGRLFISDDGKVGIGVSDPSSYNVSADDLVIADPNGFNSGISINITDNTGSSNIWFGDSDGEGRGQISYGHGISDSMDFWVGGAQNLALYETGALAHIGGGSVITPAVSFNGSAPSNSLVIDSTGKVGLGTSSPSSVFDANVTSDDSSIFEISRFTANNSGGTSLRLLAGQSNIDTTLRRVAIDSFRADTNVVPIDFTQTTSGGTSTRMRIDSLGRVGIGTTSPGSALEIDAAAATSPFIAKINTSEAARIDSSGRLLIGTSSSTTASHLVIAGTSSGDAYGIARICSTSSTPGNGDLLGLLSFGDSSHTNAAWVRAERDGGTWTSGSSQPARLVFSTTADGASSPTERMRITSGGDVRIGQTSTTLPSESGSVTGIGFDNSGVISASTTNQRALTLGRTEDDTLIREYVRFLRHGTNLAGTITATKTTVAYNTSSDYRLKENIVALTGAADRLKQLKPSQFNFIADPGKTVDGFLAHEAQAVVPECVTGAKDAVDDDGNPVYQGIDQSKLVPLLTAALQEALTKIETLEQRLSDAGIA